MKLILTDDNGEVLGQWSIGHEIKLYEGNDEEEQKHDFYITDERGHCYDDAETIGDEIWDAVLKYKDQGRQ